MRRKSTFVKVIAFVSCLLFSLTGCEMESQRVTVSLYDQMETVSDYMISFPIGKTCETKEEMYDELGQLCMQCDNSVWDDSEDEKTLKWKAFYEIFDAWLSNIDYEDPVYTKEKLREIFYVDKELDLKDAIGNYYQYEYLKSDFFGLQIFAINYDVFFEDYISYKEDASAVFFECVSTLSGPQRLDDFLEEMYVHNDRWKTEDGHATYLKMERFQNILEMAKHPFFAGRKAELIAKTEQRLTEFTIITDSNSSSYGWNSNSSSYSNSSNSSNHYDSYGANYYDDPEDFADDWEDDFDSWDDAYEYWEDYAN